MDEQTLIQKAKEVHIKIYGLSSYSIEKFDEHPPKIILGFAGIPESELKNAIHLLLNSWGL
jgi:GntR family transcriptional regulator/MocR family aminotransferase